MAERPDPRQYRNEKARQRAITIRLALVDNGLARLVVGLLAKRIF
jgi:hypothetical protein